MREIKVTKGLDENDDAKKIRTKVFIEEQHFTREFDEIDAVSTHVTVYENGIAAGTGRVFKKEAETYIIGRVAVLPEFRSRHIGKCMIQTLEKQAVILGAKQIELCAQIQAKEFYKRLGYRESGAQAMEETVLHVTMEKRLESNE